MSEEAKERVFIYTFSDLEKYLELQYSFDPWMCPKGYPIVVGDQAAYWVLVSPQTAADIEAGDADTIGRLRCFVQIPVIPTVETSAGYGTVYIPHQDDKSKPPEDMGREWAAKGYVLLHKDHITAKGTILTLIKKLEHDPLPELYRKPEEAKTGVS